MTQYQLDSLKHFEQNIAISMSNTQICMLQDISKDLNEIITRENASIKQMMQLVEDQKQLLREIQYCNKAAELAAESIHQLPDLQQQIQLSKQLIQ